jgi:hypothetical protein
MVKSNFVALSAICRWFKFPAGVLLLLMVCCDTATASFCKEMQPGITSNVQCRHTDTTIYQDATIEKLVKKFTDKRKASFNSLFAAIIYRMDTCSYVFKLVLDEYARKGAVEYDGRLVIVTISRLNPTFGTEKGEEGCLFEEVKHVEQFLNGKTRFRHVGNEWKAESNLYNEVEAKMFVAANFEINEVYTDYIKDYSDYRNKVAYYIPTVLHYMKGLANDEERALYLIHGAAVQVNSVYGFSRTNYTLIALYSDGTLQCIDNQLTTRIKTDSLFGYPRVVQ